VGWILRPRDLAREFTVTSRPVNATSSETRLIAILADAAGLRPPNHLAEALFAEMDDLQELAAVLKKMPLEKVQSAGVFRVPVR
jgi:hypothetical protein